MQSQWSWLIQVTICMEAHVKYTSNYTQFFDGCIKCEYEMTQTSQLLSSRYDEETLDIEESKRRVQELREMHEHISEIERQIGTLVQLGYEIVPITERDQPSQIPCRVKCLCTYRQPEVKENDMFSP